MMTLIRNVFHSRVMYEVVVQLLRDYLPAGQDFVIRNLNSMVNSRQRVQFALAGDSAGDIFGCVSSAGSSAEPHLALREEPVLPGQSARFVRPRVCLRSFGAAVDCADGCSSWDLWSSCCAVRNRLHARRRIPGDEGVRDRGEHRHLLPHLLGAAEWESASACRSARSHHHGTAFGGAEVRVYPRAAVAELSGSLWTVRAVGHDDVLGVLVRTAAAGGSATCRQKSICGTRSERESSLAVSR